MIKTFIELFREVEIEGMRIQERYEHGKWIFRAYCKFDGGGLYVNVTGFLQIWNDAIPINYNGQQLPRKDYNTFINYCEKLVG